MPGLDTILLALVLTAAVGPLVLVGVCAIAAYFDLGIAGWLLDVTVRALAWQWQIGGWVNLAGGLALAAMGVWFAVHDGSLPQRIGGCLLLVLFGLWRAWRGGSIVWGRDRDA